MELLSFTAVSLPHSKSQELSIAGFRGAALLFGQYPLQRDQEQRLRKMCALRTKGATVLALSHKEVKGRTGTLLCEQR